MRSAAPADRPAGRGAGRAALALGAAALVFYATFAWRTVELYEGERVFTLFDDAMVSMTYGRNLAQGHGLVWNAGGEAVEGYTNPLWTVWMAVPHAIGIPDIWTSLFVMASGAVLLLVTLAGVARLVGRIGLASPALGSVALLGTAFSFPLAFWTLRGMEVGAVVAVVVWSLVGVARLEEATRDGRAGRRRLLGLAALLCAGLLLRPDFLLPGVACIAGAVAVVPPRERRHTALVLTLCLCATWLAMTGFRLATYGEWLPNTYTLKIAGHGLLERMARGSASLRDALFAGLWAPWLLAALALRHPALRRPVPRVLLGVVLLQTGYSVAVGGDSWETFGFANRFLAVAIPPLLLLSALGVEVALPRRRALGPGLALGCALLLWLPMNGRDFLRWAREGAVNANLDQAMARRGLRIRAHTPPDTVIAVMWAGAIPYFAHRAAVDLMGKNDPVIARSDPVLRLGVPGHTKYDLSHSLGALRPDLVVQVFAPRPEDVAYVTGLGYVPAPRALGKYATPQLLARIDLSRVPEEEPAPGPPRGALRRLREGSRRSGDAR